MKVILPSLAFLFFCNLSVFSQTATNKLDTVGNVGIGTITPSSKLDVTTNALGTTQTTTSGLGLVNNTAATSALQQISPAIRWSAKGWATTSSQSVDFRTFVVPLQGTPNPTGYLSFGSSVNGSAYSDNQFVLTTTGNIGVGTSAPAAKFEALSSVEQLRLSYNVGNYASFTVGSNGALTIKSNNAQSVIFNDGFTSPNTSGNFLMPAYSGGAYNANAAYTIGGAAQIGYRIALRGTGANSLLANYSGANLLVGGQSITTASTGTHSIIAQQAIKPLTILGSGSVTNAATLYIENAATSYTNAPINNYALWVDDGVTRFDGNVGIGTDKPGVYKLAVNGDAIFTKIRVRQYNNWPDYVFGSAYKLLSLAEVEAFIKRYKHLPDVPSAAEVKMDGFDVSENQAVLLKKIEELTLYLIDLQKQVDQQKEKINQQEKAIKRLKVRLKGKANS